MSSKHSQVVHEFRSLIVLYISPTPSSFDLFILNQMTHLIPEHIDVQETLFLDRRKEKQQSHHLYNSH